MAPRLSQNGHFFLVLLPQSIHHVAITSSIDCLTSGKEVHQKDISGIPEVVAIILCTTSTVLNFFLGGGSVHFDVMEAIYLSGTTLVTQILLPVMIWSSNPLLVDIYHIKHSKHKPTLMFMIVTQLLLAPTCRHLPVCYKQFHALKFTKMLRCTTNSHFILGQPVCDSLVWPTWLFWNALHQMESCLLLITYS